MLSWRFLGPLFGSPGLSWPLLGLSWAALGLSWVALGLSWVALGLSWVLEITPLVLLTKWVFTSAKRYFVQIADANPHRVLKTSFPGAARPDMRLSKSDVGLLVVISAR